MWHHVHPRWDVSLAQQMGGALGRAFRAKGANGVLGPSVDLARVPSAGRNVESLSGEDGHLGAPLAAELVRGARAGAEESPRPVA